jgi:hypothetical protein
MYEACGERVLWQSNGGWNKRLSWAGRRFVFDDFPAEIFIPNLVFSPIRQKKLSI